MSANSPSNANTGVILAALTAAVGVGWLVSGTGGERALLAFGAGVCVLMAGGALAAAASRPTEGSGRGWTGV
ncbi:MAG: hypothetical protein KF718_24160 [Polyangiaceae bacterium]|nr:hypothetical protein [Polyangiaceae bacterium]